MQERAWASGGSDILLSTVVGFQERKIDHDWKRTKASRKKTCCVQWLHRYIRPGLYGGAHSGWDIDAVGDSSQSAPIFFLVHSLKINLQIIQSPLQASHFSFPPFSLRRFFFNYYYFSHNTIILLSLIHQPINTSMTFCLEKKTQWAMYASWDGNDRILFFSPFLLSRGRNWLRCL